MKNVILFETNKIKKDSDLFNQFKNQNIFFYYFQISEKYYLFLFAEKPISLDFTVNLSEIEVIRKIDSKQRQLRSLRGFILYVLELRMTKPNKEIATNLKPFFWTDVERVLNKRKKNGLKEFLFGKEAQEVEEDINIKLEKMQNQIEKLRSEISFLKNQSNLQGNFKYSKDLTDEQIKDLKTNNHVSK